MTKSIELYDLLGGEGVWRRDYKYRIEKHGEIMIQEKVTSDRKNERRYNVRPALASLTRESPSIVLGLDNNLNHEVLALELLIAYHN